MCATGRRTPHQVSNTHRQSRQHEREGGFRVSLDERQAPFHVIDSSLSCRSVQIILAGCFLFTGPCQSHTFSDAQLRGCSRRTSCRKFNVNIQWRHENQRHRAISHRTTKNNPKQKRLWYFQFYCALGQSQARHG
jgi:hypothetical protein